MSSEVQNTIFMFMQPPSFGKFCHMFLLSFTFVCLVAHTSVIVRTYFSYPTFETTSDEHVFEFPDVTLCHSARRSSYRGNRFDGDGNKTFSAFKTFKSLERFWQTYHTNSTDVSSTSKYRPIARKSFHDYLHMNKAFKRPEDFVVDCTFRSEPCSFLNFTIVFDADLYYCFTMKFNGVSVSEEGEESGLRLLLYGSDTSNIMKSYEEYMHFLEGFRVIIHPKDSYPSSRDWTAFVEVNTRTDVAVTMREKRILDLDRKLCEEEHKIQLYNHGVFAGNFSYTPELCSHLEKQELFVKKCGCLSPRFPVSHSQRTFTSCFSVPLHPFLVDSYFHSVNGTIFVTNSSNSVAFWSSETGMDWMHFRRKLRCHEEVRFSLVNMHDDLRHACSPLCRKVSYVTSVLKRKWPSARTFSLKYSAAALNKMIESNYMLAESSNVSLGVLTGAVRRKLTSAESLASHFMFMTVYPGDILNHVVREELAYPISNLFSDFGGCIGLWVGWSAMTVLLFVWSIGLYLGGFTRDRQLIKDDDD